MQPLGNLYHVEQYKSSIIVHYRAIFKLVSLVEGVNNEFRRLAIRGNEKLVSFGLTHGLVC